MKKTAAFLLALVLLLSAAGCGVTEVTKDVVENTVEEAEVLSGYPVTVTDQAGREVVIEGCPETVVSGYYISSSALIALGQEEKLVGIEAKADKRPIYRLAAPRLMELPSVGTAKEFDLEGCAALEPDLVILPLKLKEAAATLESLGMDVLLVNPENGSLLAEMIELLGAALDCRSFAEDLLTAMAAVEEITAKSLLSSVLPTVYLAGNSSFLSTAPNGMYQSDLISLAGGVNAAVELEDTYWAEVSYEQVLAWDPDVILLASDASYTVEDVLQDPALAGCTAVEQGKVWQMPAAAEAWDSPVPGSVLGALWLASKLHPEFVSDETVNETVVEFYETFYGFTYPS